MLRNGHAIIILALSALSCGRGKTVDEHSGAPSAADSLRQHQAAWLAELKETVDPATGWPSVTDCDALLWTSLAVAGGLDGVRLELAEHSPGVLHRRPTPCWTPEAGDVGSKSTISRDMLTGYIYALWRRGDLAGLQRLADYGAANEWIMGQPWPEMRTRVELGDNLKGVLCRAIRSLSAGADERRECGKVQPLYLPVAEDYERHVQTLGILLQGEVDRALRAGDAIPAGGDEIPEQPVTELTAIDGAMLARLQANHEAMPHDALFRAALGVYTGDYAEAIWLLEDDGYQCSSYVRPEPIYCLINRVFAASVVLRYHEAP